MSCALLVGAGAVGARAARQLVDTPGLTRLLVADRRAARAEAVAHAMGEKAEAIEWHAAAPLPVDADVVACALPAGADLAVAERALAAGRAFATVTDDRDSIEALLGLDERARAAGVTLAVGCGLAPGLADVLARHAAGALDHIDEAHVARSGVAGPASVAALRHALHERPTEWRDGAWLDARPMGPELVWFPDPIGARDCTLAAGGLALIVRALPGLSHATLRLADPPPRKRRILGPRETEGSWGTTRVEVHGRRGSTVESIVFGVVERTAVAAGSVLAVAVAQLAGALEGQQPRTPGAHGLAELVEPVSFLAELARRGVRAAVYEGVPVA